MDLFTPVVPVAALNSRFVTLANSPASEPARCMMQNVARHFVDKDGNFVQQLQTDGFDARTFELYLFAYFRSADFKFHQKYDRPDFIMEREGVYVSVEATTTNPSSNPSLKHVSLDESCSELMATLQIDELPIRFGSPLFSKLSKEYWKLDQVAGRPFVIAIEAFHDEVSLFFSGSALGSYLFGLRPKATVDASGRLKITTDPVEFHSAGLKTIPSSFFAQPNAEYVSAVLFTNSGTVPKFGRMGYHEGYRSGRLKGLVTTNLYDPSPNAATPRKCVYDLSTPPFRESWGHGVEVYLNPNALHPLPHDFFPDAAQNYVENGTWMTDVPRDPPHSFASLTAWIASAPRELPAAVQELQQREFYSLVGPPRLVVPGVTPEECGWYATQDRTRAAVLLRDPTDDDFGFLGFERGTSSDLQLTRVDAMRDTYDEAFRSLLAFLRRGLGA